jgi:cation:H+ antiporter
MFGDPHAKEEIANGAILGAPIMLATLGFTIIGLAALIKRDTEVKSDPFLIKRDLTFFMLMFTPALVLAFVPDAHYLKLFYGLVLFFGYGYYVYHVLKEGGEEVEAGNELYFNRYLRLPEHLAISFIQLLASLLVLLVAVEVFVHAIAAISKAMGISPLVFSLLVAPVATELPEKFNSFFWSLRGKYELAFGNITGAMVFQSAIPVSVGLIFTDWHISVDGILSGILALVGALLILGQLLLAGRIKSPLLLLNGLLYLVYIVVVFITH